MITAQHLCRLLIESWQEGARWTDRTVSALGLPSHDLLLCSTAHWTVLSYVMQQHHHLRRDTQKSKCGAKFTVVFPRDLFPFPVCLLCAHMCDTHKQSKENNLHLIQTKKVFRNLVRFDLCCTVNLSIAVPPRAEDTQNTFFSSARDRGISGMDPNSKGHTSTVLKKKR